MSRGVDIIAEGRTVTVHVPLRYRKRGGRKVIIGEVRTGNPSPPPAKHGADQTILKALGRAYRWKRMLESGEFNSITDLANAEKINHAYVRRILRLTLLSPAITEAILDSAPSYIGGLQRLLASVSEDWTEQGALLR